MAVVGLPGSGKTTIMAEFIKRLRKRGEKEKDLVVFYHVVASSPQSFSVKNMLVRLCEFLKKRCGLTLEVPKTMSALRDRFVASSIQISRSLIIQISRLIICDLLSAQVHVVRGSMSVADN